MKIVFMFLVATLIAPGLSAQDPPADLRQPVILHEAYEAVTDMRPPGSYAVIDDPYFESLGKNNPSTSRSTGQPVGEPARVAALVELATMTGMPFKRLEDVFRLDCSEEGTPCLRAPDLTGTVSLAISETDDDTSATVIAVWRYPDISETHGTAQLVFQGVEVMLKRDGADWVVVGFGRRVSS